MPFEGGLIIRRQVSHCKAVGSPGIKFCLILDTGLLQRDTQAFYLLGRHGIIVISMADINFGLNFVKKMMRAFRCISGQIACVEACGGGDAVRITDSSF